MIAEFAGLVDTGDDGFGLEIRRRREVIALSIDGFAGFGVFKNDLAHFLLRWFGFGLNGGLDVLRNELGVSLPVVFEHAVVALEPAFGGGYVAREKVMLLDKFGLPSVQWRIVMVAEKEIIFVLGTLTEPFSLGGFDNKGVEHGIIGWILIFGEPGVEQFEPLGFAFVREYEGFRAEAMTGGVAGGGSSSDD